MDYVSTYGFYDYKGRRIAAFCRFIAPTEAEIFLLTCSKEDLFNKKFARTKYKEYIYFGVTTECTPEIEIVTILPEERELKTLFRYLRKNFYILRNIDLPVPILLTYEQHKEIKTLTSCQNQK